MSNIDFSNLTLKDFVLNSKDYMRMGQYAKVLEKVDRSLLEEYGQMLYTFPPFLRETFGLVFDSLSILVLEVRALGFTIFAKLDDSEIYKLEFKKDILDDEEADKDAIVISVDDDDDSEFVYDLVVRSLLVFSHKEKRYVYKVTNKKDFVHLSTSNLSEDEKVIAPKIGMTPWIKVC
jgi:hypothetical protein